MLTDLAAALLVRAERHQTPRDLLEAIEVADRALELAPQNEPARFNLALALDRLGLDGQARGAWRAYLAVDSTSRWAGEARKRSKTSVQAPEPPPAPGVNPSTSELSAYVDAAPEAATLFGWDHALAEWGAAVMAGDTTRAGEFLNLAGRLGEQLERRGGDATLADAVHDIRKAAGRPRRVRALADAHRLYGAGRAAYRAGDNSAAAKSLAQVIAMPGTSPPLLGWARFYRAATLVYEGKPAAAEAVLAQVIRYADTLRHPSLAGRARWGLGTTLLRSGRYEQAIRAVREAAPLFDRAREYDNVGIVQALEADARHYLPDPVEVYPAIHRALTTLRPYRKSVWLHNLMIIAAPFTAGDGLTRAAVRLQNEGVEVAAGIQEPIWIAESRIARARLLATAGMSEMAEEDVRAARVLVESLPPGPQREWFQADLRLAEAASTLADDPRRAIPALDSVAAFFEAQHNQVRFLPTLIARSGAALAIGNVSAASADLDRALTLLDRQSSSLTRAELRASHMDAVRKVVDQLVMLRIRAGSPTAALADLERARISLAAVGSRRAANGPAMLTTPPGQIAVEYALIGDTLLLWTVAGSTVQLATTTVDRAELTRTVERVRASLELGATAPGLLPDLAALYDRLIRPVRRDLAPLGSPLVLIADGEIAGVPFAALRDTADGRYLIEQHPLRFAGSLRDVRRTPHKRLPTLATILLVADPAFDPRAYPGLKRLPGAVAEVGAIAAHYPDNVVLAGPRATRASFERALQQTNIIHYAGHAVFDDERPEQSVLVLASGPDSEAQGRLTAAELQEMDLNGLGLVVLSACETIRSRRGRSGGFAGLSGAFLFAGAAGVVGSLWRVDDQWTRTLMSEFHRAYRHSTDGAGALREAQLRLLNSTDAALRSPAAWAAFRYAGR